MELGRIVQLAKATQETLDKKERSLGRSLTTQEMEAEAGVPLEQIQVQFLLFSCHTQQTLKLLFVQATRHDSWHIRQPCLPLTFALLSQHSHTFTLQLPDLRTSFQSETSAGQSLTAKAVE